MPHPHDTTSGIQMDAFLAGSPAGIPGAWREALRVHGLPGGVSVSCFDGERLPPWEFPSEGSSAFSLCVLLEGRMRATLEGGRMLDLREGMTAFMLSGQPMRGWNVLDEGKGRRFRMVDFHLTPQAIGALAGPHLAAVRDCPEHACGMAQGETILGSLHASSTLRRAACDILACDYPRGHLHDLYLGAKTQEALAALLHDLARLCRPQPLSVLADHKRLQEARAIIERHFDEDWSARSLARAVGLNEKRLQAGFQALFGQSFLACLTHIRMQAALHMLEHGASVTETASSVGYASLSHFSKIFRQHMGIRPGRWVMEHAARTK
jgi:AraC-like DNA-binding protein